MADITTFPTVHDVLVAGSNIFTMLAGADIKAGMVVAISATGVSGTVVPSVAEVGAHSIGVALYDAPAGRTVAIAGPGCIVYAANADDTVAIDAGDRVESNDNPVGGTISMVAEDATGGATAVTHADVIGYALDDISGGGVGRIIIMPHAYTQANSN